MMRQTRSARWISLVALVAALAACEEEAQEGAPSPTQDLGQEEEQGEDAAPDAVEPDGEEPDLVTPDMGGPECDFAPEAAEEAIPAPVLYTPRWAFEPWISKDISDRDDTYAFVDGFQERDIPVGVVVLDSPWATNYNTFIPNPSRYPEFDQMVADLRARDIRVVLWTTQLVNRTSYDVEEGGDFYDNPSPNYPQGRACDFFINDGRSYSWWKGSGASVDFFNPQAMHWWHLQQDRVLDAGIAGWKLDFGDSYVRQDVVETAAGPKPFQEYSEAYYEDFLAYGQHKRGKEEFVTMVRAWDVSYDHSPRFYARPEHAPVIWVGDNRRDFVGLIDALDHTFLSASAGYAMIGSDIGGYLDRNDLNLVELVPFSYPALARWTAIGSLSPFMQLHGRANLTPWTLPEGPEDPATFTAIYRYWSWLHSDMVPFWYSATAEAHAGGDNVLRPVGETPEDWIGDWRYQIGDALLVAPILDEAGARDVALPAGARWYNWWDLGADPVEGGQTLMGVDATDLGRVPLYVREGAILPMTIRNDATGLCDARCAGALTVLVWPSSAPTSFRLHESEALVTEISASQDLIGAQVTLERASTPVIVRLRQDAAPGGVELGGAPLTARADADALFAAEEGWFHDAAAKATWVKVAASEGPVQIATRP
jgi:alpha-glucosidase (family GH31 glycosyl hydrolase)